MGGPKNFPWTMGWQPSFQSEARIFAKHLLETKPGAKVAVLYQNDDYGKDYLEGFEAGLGDKAKSMIVSKVTYEVTDPTVDSQMVTLQASGADAFFNVTTPKFAAQAIKKAAELGWKPLHYLNSVSTSVATVMRPAGVEAGVGIITAGYSRIRPTRKTRKATATATGLHGWRSTTRAATGRTTTTSTATRLRQCLRSGPQAGWRRTDPRQHHEAGGQPRPHPADAG